MRKFFVFLTVIVIVASLALPAFAADDHVVYDYSDFVIFEDVDSNGFVRERIQIPSELCAVAQHDSSGWTYLDSGVTSGSVTGVEGDSMSVNYQCPGGVVNGRFLSVHNIPTGSDISISARCYLDNPGTQTYVGITARIIIQYFNSNFYLVDSQSSSNVVGYIDGLSGSAIWQDNVVKEFNMNVPMDAKYFTIGVLVIMDIERSNDESSVVNWSFGSPDIHLNKGVPADEWGDDLGAGFVTWFTDIASSFLELEIVPGYSFNKILYVILLVGLLGFLFKVLS